MGIVLEAGAEDLKDSGDSWEVISDVASHEAVLAALQKGARHFVQKPVKADALYEIIRYVLNDDGVTSPVGAGTETSR